MAASQVAAETRMPARPKAIGLDPAALIASCLTFALVLFLPPILNDGDTLWQIRTGAWILDHRAIPATDPLYLLNPPGALIRRAEWREWLGMH